MIESVPEDVSVRQPAPRVSVHVGTGLADQPKKCFNRDDDLG